MFIVGLFFALTGNVVIGLGNCLQKYALTRAQQSSSLPLRHPRAIFDNLSGHRSHNSTGVGNSSTQWFHRTVWDPLILHITAVGATVSASSGKPYSRFQDKLWWLGIFLSYAGEAFGNWIALSLISASTVTPLGIVGVMVNAYLASDLLGETVSRRQQHGYAWILAGVALILFSTAPTESVAGETIEDAIVRGGPGALVRYIGSWWVVAWVACLLFGLAGLGYRVWAVQRLERLVRETGAAKAAADDHVGSANDSGKRPTHATAAAVRTAGGVNGAATVYHRQTSRVLTLYVCLTALFGALVVMTSKFLALLLRCWVAPPEAVELAIESLNGTIAAAVEPLSPVTQSLTFTTLLTLLVLAVVAQETCKQLALQSFPLTQFQPTFYAAHVTLVTVSSLALFDRVAGWWVLAGIAVGVGVIAKGGSVLLGWEQIGVGRKLNGMVKRIREKVRGMVGGLSGGQGSGGKKETEKA